MTSILFLLSKDWAEKKHPKRCIPVGVTWYCHYSHYSLGGCKMGLQNLPLIHLFHLIPFLLSDYQRFSINFCREPGSTVLVKSCLSIRSQKFCWKHLYSRSWEHHVTGGMHSFLWFELAMAAMAIHHWFWGQSSITDHPRVRLPTALKLFDHVHIGLQAP